MIFIFFAKHLFFSVRKVQLIMPTGTLLGTYLKKYAKCTLPKHKFAF